MQLSPGDLLGPYEILAPIGEGGMGVVYRAKDGRLGREVAIKVLSEEFSQDPERVSRFKLEARAAGMLNHPNILAVYDLGTHEGKLYLVTELLEGDTLRERLREGPLPQRKALVYAQQIASGLAAAHDKGVTHRDLKPENLFILRDGSVKILDFGLAKMASLEQMDPKLSAGGKTQKGVVLGTVGYMSPEQAQGQTADARSDIFSLGVVLYEMISGRRAFRAPTVVEILAQIVRNDPPPLEAPPPVVQLVNRCIEKEAAERFQSARDLSFAIQGLASMDAAPAVQPSRQDVVSKSSVAVTGVICLALAAVAWVWWQARHEAASLEWHAARLTGSGIAYGPRVSPDGGTVAFCVVEGTQSQVAIMHPGAVNWTLLTHNTTRGEPEHICWSRDGTKLYFDRRDGPYRVGFYSVPALGGEERLVLEQAMGPEELPDGSFLIARINADRKRQVFHYYPESGRIDPLDLEVTAQMRRFPDGKEAVSLVRKLSDSKQEVGLRVFDVTSGKARLLPLGNDFTATGAMAVSPDGKSVFVECHGGDLNRVVEIARDGQSKPHTVLTVTETIANLDVAPDGKIYIDQLNRPYDVLRFPVSGGAPELVVETSAGSYSPIALPDGRVLLSSSLASRETVLVVKSGQDPVPFVETEEQTRGPLAVLGSQQVALRIGKSPDWVVAIASVTDGRILRRLDSTRGLLINSLSGSPDGKTIYYVAQGAVWALPTDGAEPRKLTAGDAVAANPNGQDVVVMRRENDGVHLVRIPAAGTEQPIPYTSPLVLSAGLAPGAVRGDGRIAVTVLRPDSWWDESGILDPTTGQVTKLNVPYSGDAFNVGWTQDGRMISGGLLMRGSLWRFQR